MSSELCKRVAVVTARFGTLYDRGLSVVLEEDPGLAVVAGGVPFSRLEDVAMASMPCVVVVNMAHLARGLLISSLNGLGPGVGVVVLADELSVTDAHRLFAFGVTVVCSAAASPDDLCRAIKVTARGERAMSLPASGARRLSSLTRREWDVLRLLQAGMSAAEIALSLHIAIGTARTHIKQARRKLATPPTGQDCDDSVTRTGIADRM